MADENKKVSAENTKPAKQVKDKKAEKPAKTAKVKDKKPNVFVRMGRSIRNFAASPKRSFGPTEKPYSSPRL